MPDPSPDAEPLADLLQRAGAGDASALSDLLRRYERRVRLAARSLLRPGLRTALDSIDLVQSVHRALLPGLRDGRYAFADENQLVALAVTVLRHKVRRTARRQRPTATDPNTLPPGTDPAAAPGDTAAEEEVVARLLAELEPIDRRLIEMRLADVPTTEIAESLGLTPAVLRARLSRLRKRLRDSGLEEWIQNRW